MGTQRRGRPHLAAVPSGDSDQTLQVDRTGTQGAANAPGTEDKPRRWVGPRGGRTRGGDIEIHCLHSVQRKGYCAVRTTQLPEQEMRASLKI